MKADKETINAKSKGLYNRLVKWKYWKVVFVLVGALLIVFFVYYPILFYRNHFNGGLSTNFDDWTKFATFVSGTSGVIVSLISVIILGFITYLVSKNSSSENLRLFYVKYKVEGYDNLEAICSVYREAKNFANQISKLEGFCRGNVLQAESILDVYKAKIDSLNERVEALKQLRVDLKAFQRRYRHIFDGGINVDDFLLFDALLFQLVSQIRRKKDKWDLNLSEDDEEYDDLSIVCNSIDDIFERISSKMIKEIK